MLVDEQPTTPQWQTIDDLPIHPSWRGVLEPVMDQIRDLGQFLTAETEAGRGFLPPEPDIFRAFSYPLEEVKVLILGQDPYPTPGHSMGLCFSTQPGVRPLPRSLVNIFKEMATDLGVSINATDGDLRPWSRQGVMLLNRVLTVQPGNSNSHKGRGWEAVTEAAITALGQRNQPLVAILWGRQAQAVQKFLGDTPCITSAHPSPLSASRGFFGSRPFSATNRMLDDLGATPVDWRL